MLGRSRSLFNFHMVSRFETVSGVNASFNPDFWSKWATQAEGVMCSIQYGSNASWSAMKRVRVAVETLTMSERDLREARFFTLPAALSTSSGVIAHLSFGAVSCLPLPLAKL